MQRHEHMKGHIEELRQVSIALVWVRVVPGLDAFGKVGNINK